MIRQTIEFQSQGERCVGELWRPDNVAHPPIIVMAHGFAAERTFALPRFAERFIDEGWATLLFDYRTFGESEGQPRQLVDPFRHLQDWKAALAFARRLDDINTHHMILWGSSFSGGHVMVTAAHDANVKGIIAQVPFVSGLGTLQHLAFPTLAPRVVMGLADLAAATLRMPPVTIKVVGHPGQIAALSTPESHPGYMAIVAPDSDWVNAVPARIALQLPLYNPAFYAKKVRCPALVIGGRNDSVCPLRFAEEAARKMPRGQLEILDCNHFEPYEGDWFESNIALQIRFLYECFAH